MSELRTFGTEEQIAAIDGAVENGWQITQVAVDESFNANVTFAKSVKEPEPLFNGDTIWTMRDPQYQTVTQTLGCGYEAMLHAKRLMHEGPVRLIDPIVPCVPPIVVDWPTR